MRSPLPRFSAKLHSPVVRPTRTTAATRAASRAVASVAVLESVRLAELHAAMRGSPDSLTGEHSYSLDHAPAPPNRLDDHTVEVLVTLGLGLRKKGDSEDWGNIRASVVLVYTFEETAPPEGKLASFAQVNAVYNAWPYLRELVQSLTVRMGMPPLTLPLYRVHAPVNPGQAKAGKDQR
jgi:preprotein translocase subunit SecB